MRLGVTNQIIDDSDSKAADIDRRFWFDTTDSSRRSRFRSNFDLFWLKDWSRDRKSWFNDQKSQLKDRKSWLNDWKSWLNDQKSQFFIKKLILYQKDNQIWSISIHFLI